MIIVSKHNIFFTLDGLATSGCNLSRYSSTYDKTTHQDSVTSYTDFTSFQYEHLICCRSYLDLTIIENFRYLMLFPPCSDLMWRHDSQGRVRAEGKPRGSGEGGGGEEEAGEEKEEEIREEKAHFTR